QLEKENYRVIPDLRTAEAITINQHENTRLVLVDVVLPGKDGWRILVEFRIVITMPVIMLTALGETPVRFTGFNIGADDYIPKPFVAEEVVARVKAVLRRNLPDSNHTLTFGSLQLKPQAHEVRVNGKIIELTPKDSALLLFLAEHPNQAFTREQLLEHVWG